MSRHALRRSHALVAAALLWSASAAGQQVAPPPQADPTPGERDAPVPSTAEAERHWYERLSLRGYTQLRYNGIGASNPRLTNRQADRTLGADGGLSIRRARLILTADVAPFLSIYLQPDFASAIDESLHVGQLRDWYADIFLDPREKMFRIRAGQSKVPYQFGARPQRASA